jgi:hypothetical protein
MPRFLDPFSEPKDFGFKARGLQDTCHQLFIFRMYLKDKKRRFKTNLTLNLILRFNLRLGGYSIWSAIFHRTPYKRRLEAIRGIAPHSLDATKEVLEEDLQDGVSEEAKDYFISTRNACSTQL